MEVHRPVFIYAGWLVKQCAWLHAVKQLLIKPRLMCESPLLLRANSPKNQPRRSASLHLEAVLTLHTGAAHVVKSVRTHRVSLRGLLKSILGEQTETVERDLATNSCSAFPSPLSDVDLTLLQFPAFDEKFIPVCLLRSRVLRLLLDAVESRTEPRYRSHDLLTVFRLFVWFNP